MKRRIALVALLVTTSLLITACNGSEDNMGPVDSFISFVKSMVATSDDTVAPVSVDNTAVSDSDTSAPVAVY